MSSLLYLIPVALFLGGLGLAAKLMEVTGYQLQGVPALPSWLSAAAAVLAVGILLLGPWPYCRSRLLRPEALRLRNDDPDHFRGRDEDVETGRADRARGSSRQRGCQRCERRPGGHG